MRWLTHAGVIMAILLKHKRGILKTAILDEIRLLPEEICHINRAEVYKTIDRMVFKGLATKTRVYDCGGAGMPPNLIELTTDGRKSAETMKLILGNAMEPSR